MPNFDGTGPDGKGPKKENKGWPSRDGRGMGKGRNRQNRSGNRGRGNTGRQGKGSRD